MKVFVLLGLWMNILPEQREVEIWGRALSMLVKFYSPSQTSGFFRNIWMAKNYPHRIRY